MPLSSFIPYKILDSFESFIMSDYPRTKSFLNHVNPKMLEDISKKKALRAFKEAARRTPAYKSFLRNNKVDLKEIHSIGQFDLSVPQTDKENYIKKYGFEQRCKFGKFPEKGNLDESGGTSGKPTNWVHDFDEETLLFKAVNFEYNYAFDGGNKNHLVINTWSTGPWATGIKFCEMMEKISLVKNTATDPKEVIDTLKMFGKERTYLLSGYPPFIKNLLDDYEKEINWREYDIDIVTGGEGIPLEWVYYVKNKLKPGARVVSSYGCSDIDIGIGFETPLSFFIRELAGKDEKLRLELFGKEELPMLFQYNPLMHYIRNVVNDGKPEYEITLLDTSAASPKIKYNLHDEGKKFSYLEIIDLLSKHYPDYSDLFLKKGEKSSDILHLPFLCVFGRSDGTLSFDGANVYPEQIERGILGEKKLAKYTNRFKMEKKYDKKHTASFQVHLELKKGVKVNSALNNLYAKQILMELLKINPDFRESYAKNKTLVPHINLYPFEHHLFRQDDGKVKNIYLKK